MKSKLEKSFAFKGFRKELTDQYGDRKGADIWGYAVQELSKLEAEESNADRNSMSYVFPAVALYRAVERYAPGDALKITRNYGTKMGIRLKRIFRRITALPGVPTLMWKNINKIATKMSKWCKSRIDLDEHIQSTIKEWINL